MPDLVLAEVCQVLLSRIGTGAEGVFLRSIAASGLVIEHLTHDDLVRSADLLDRYADLRIGAVDAAVVAIAERLSIRTIATLDRRHFSVIRPRHVERFVLVPEPDA